MGYFLSVATIAGINVIMALSFYLPFITGQISLGQAGFMALGAYASAVCTVKLGLPYPLALLLGGLFAGVIGILVGLPALRIKGLYLLLMTLGFGEIVRVVFINLQYTGGAAGFYDIRYQKYSIFYVYGFVLLLIIFFARLRRSRMGRAFSAIGGDETAAEVMGVDLTRSKLMAFSTGAFIAGVAGGIFAHYQEYIEPLMFGVMHSVEFIVFTIFGGIQIFWGPIFGALALTFTPEFLRVLQAWRLEFYGVILILMMIVRPLGLVQMDTLYSIGQLFRSWGPEGGR